MSPAQPIKWAHAPSTAPQWMACAGSVAMQRGLPDSAGAAAEDGTRLHAAAAACIAQWAKTRTMPALVDLLRDAPEDHAMVAPYVDFVVVLVRSYEGAGATVLIQVENEVDLEDVLGVPARGTPDLVLVAEWPDGDTIVHVLDYKSGYEPVPDDTPQLGIYLAAVCGPVAAVSSLKGGATTVVQPRVSDKPAIMDWTPEEIEAFVADVKPRAQLAYELAGNPAAALDHLVAGEKQCRWCKAAKAVQCPAYNQMVHDTVFGEATDIAAEDAFPVDEVSWTGTPVEFHQKMLPLFMRRVRLIEHWVEYVKARVLANLTEGKAVPGYKLVQGRGGNRTWADQKAVLSVMMAHHVPRELVMEPAELKTPAAVEKALKKTHPDVYPSLKDFVEQTPGKPSVAPEDDPRPAYVPSGEAEADSYDASGMV